MWQDIVAYSIVALTSGIVVTRRVRSMRSGQSVPHCARCPGWKGAPANARGGGAGAGGGGARHGRTLIPPSALSTGRHTETDGTPRAR